MEVGFVSGGGETETFDCGAFVAGREVGAIYGCIFGFEDEEEGWGLDGVVGGVLGCDEGDEGQ